MKALDLLFRVLYEELPDLHLARLKSLIAVAGGALNLPMLSITWMENRGHPGKSGTPKNGETWVSPSFLGAAERGGEQTKPPLRPLRP